MRTHAPAAAGRTLARVLKAVLSLIVLAGVVAGLPLLLAFATPVVWAISHDDVMHLLNRQDTGAAFLMLLIAVGWAGWAQFAFCAVRELAAQLRGLTWHAPRGLGASQRAAAALIGSILVLLPAGSALATPAQAAPAQTAARLPGQAQAERSLDADQHAASTVSTSETPTYTVREVRPAESLWSIAEKELGDGECWRDIAELNEGRTMVDGQVFRANSFLQPGWQLRLPAAASADDARAHAAGGIVAQTKDSAPLTADEEEHAATVTVKPGDYLSKIAEEKLGDGNQWPELFKASRGKPQPGDLAQITDPDVIYAGQQVTVPGTQPDKHDLPQQDEDGDASGGEGRTPPAAEEPDDEKEPDEGDAQAPAPSRPTAPAPEASAPSTPTSRPTQQPGQGHGAPSATPRPGTGTSSAAPSASAESSTSNTTSSPTATAPRAPAPSAAGSPLQLRTVLGAGALLAAAVTGALAVRRLLQRRRRTPGQKITIAPEPSAAEAQLSAGAEPAGAARLDIALRTLAHHLAQDGDRELPRLRAARIGAHSLDVLPDDLAQEPKAPFTAGRNGWWTLPADAVLLNEVAARDVPPPYPGLVTMGSTETGELVLLNLAAVPAVLLDGNLVHITEVCTSLALELGMSPWASEVEVVTIGFGEDLPQLLPTSRIAHMRQPAHALRDLTERLLEAHQMPATSHQPYLLLCASTLDADTAWQFADVIDKADSVPVTLIAPASSAAAHFPEVEILNASLSKPQRLNYAGIDVTVQRLEHAAYQQITTALALSGQPAHPAEGPWRDVPHEPDSARRPEPLTAKETTVRATDTVHSPSSSALDISCSEGFPALLAAIADPPGPRLLPAMDAPGQAETEAEAEEELADDAPDTDAAPTPSSQAAAPTHVRRETSGTTIEAHDGHAPEIRVLGPVEVTGVTSTGHGPRQAQLAALLYFRPGRTADALCADMDPLTPWLASTLNARLQGLRRALGNDLAGNAYVPRRRTGDDPYQLSPAVRCDWTRFLQLAEHALPHGPAGLPDLEKALGLVRGRPFGSRPLPWAEPYQQEMITRIIDVAHTVATYRTPAGPHHDLTAARQAIVTGLDVDESAELLYRDWMRIEHTAGNRTGLHTAITRLQQINRALDCSLEIETEQLINDLLGGSQAAARTAL
ncbi:LysM peptidoglycan-binding domain-containing protein [Streptomyces sp. PSKA54]|uniref:LysM peptidoglycan-binding domain-containing protein n=1 Tax=Streptomyces himalayensis subsp. aureolus TaxID=2758039 RepID=A0A7W2D7U0_9ACTN|nr:LysM peptidoglycan-binding domain-containing protein [Streptomyces himalayensis]MBA4866229.1 LysM peptidoglycan-binding domain-containing protein [Streptomyces himalayensis subsp. aureolus]